MSFLFCREIKIIAGDDRGRSEMDALRERLDQANKKLSDISDQQVKRVAGLEQPHSDFQKIGTFSCHTAII